MAQEIAGSKFKPENSYGQNGYHGPSSTTPGKEVHYDFVASKPTTPTNSQMRTISAEPIAPAHSMRHRNLDPAKIPTGNNRAVSQIAPRGKR